jgi:hypothetical protein
VIGDITIDCKNDVARISAACPDFQHEQKVINLSKNRLRAAANTVYFRFLVVK